MERSSSLVVYSAIFGILVQFATAQTVYTVGGDMGWDIPHNSSVSYDNWVSGKTFLVGDILAFNFMTDRHDVVRVPKASYDACTGDNRIGSIITTGPANITLDSAGEHYFICTFGRHCASGQKLAVSVGSSTPGGANPPMTTPPATPTTPVTPPAGPPPPNSASTSLASRFLFTILSAGIAVIF